MPHTSHENGPQIFQFFVFKQLYTICSITLHHQFYVKINKRLVEDHHINIYVQFRLLSCLQGSEVSPSILAI